MLGYVLRLMGYEVAEGPIVFVDSRRLSDLPMYSNEIEKQIEPRSIKDFKDIVCEDS